MVEESRKYAHEVRQMVTTGILVNDIAKYLDIPKDELLLEYSDIINKGAVDYTVQVAKALYELAMGGNLQACIYWLKTVGKWEQLAEQVDEVRPTDILTDINIKLGITKADFESNE